MEDIFCDKFYSNKIQVLVVKYIASYKWWKNLNETQATNYILIQDLNRYERSPEQPIPKLNKSLTIESLTNYSRQ